MNKEMNTPEDSSNLVMSIDCEIYSNLNQHIIYITEDRLKLCLIENLRKIEKKYSWIAPLGILIAIITTCVTATFKDNILSSQTWETTFIIGGIATFIWLIVALKHAFVKINLDHVISDIKTSQKEAESKSRFLTNAGTAIVNSLKNIEI